MEQITIEKFRSVFNKVSELVVSINKEGKATLKSRSEIVKYLDGKSTQNKIFIIEELLEIYEIKAISEEYLNTKEENYWPQLSFEQFCEVLNKPLREKMDHFYFNENEKIIEKTKTQLNDSLNTNSKIILLLKKIREIKGNQPDELIFEILRNDPFYKFLIEERDHLKEIKELEDSMKSVSSLSLITFKTGINLETLETLYNKLIVNDFIQGELTTKKHENRDWIRFKGVFSGIPIKSLNGKVQWNESIPLFLSLMFGFSKKMVEGKERSFRGIVKQREYMYQTAMNCFDFVHQNTNNKDLSSKFSKVNYTKTRNFDTLLTILSDIMQ